MRDDVEETARQQPVDGVAHPALLPAVLPVITKEVFCMPTEDGTGDIGRGGESADLHEILQHGLLFFVEWASQAQFGAALEQMDADGLGNLFFWSWAMAPGLVARRCA